LEASTQILEASTRQYQPTKGMVPADTVETLYYLAYLVELVLIEHYRRHQNLLDLYQLAAVELAVVRAVHQENQN
tara:strand:- start:10 stop:234 length:225 start_codon:yes stop_codon:yes gene_type:complete